MNKKINDGSKSERSLEPVNAKLKCIEKKLVLLGNKMVKRKKIEKKPKKSKNMPFGAGKYQWLKIIK